MSFIETRINDGEIVLETVGGAEYSTTVAVVRSGYESRNVNWAQARGRWELGERMLKKSEKDAITRFFHAMRGRAYGFRFRDWADYQATFAEGILGTGAGTGLSTYQLAKQYIQSSQTQVRTIKKPNAAGFSILRNGSAATAGGGAGQYALDTTTGLVTFVADSSSNVTAFTAGATTSITLASALPSLGIGGLLHLNGINGTSGAVLNGAAHPITNLVGSVYTLGVNTTGLTRTSGGTGRKYPQPSETMTWAGDFDVPVRFDTDAIRVQFRAINEDQSEALFYLASLELVEIRL